MSLNGIKIAVVRDDMVHFFALDPEGELDAREALAQLPEHRRQPVVRGVTLAHYPHARALVGDPALVLADEPTGNLDPDNARGVLALLRDQVKGRGAAGILVTHSEAAAAGCDKRFRLTATGLARIS